MKCKYCDHEMVYEERQMTDEEFEAFACHHITKIKAYWACALDYKINSASKAIYLELAVECAEHFEQWLIENINP